MRATGSPPIPPSPSPCHRPLAQGKREHTPHTSSQNTRFLPLSSALLQTHPRFTPLPKIQSYLLKTTKYLPLPKTAHISTCSVQATLSLAHLSSVISQRSVASNPSISTLPHVLSLSFGLLRVWGFYAQRFVTPSACRSHPPSAFSGIVL